MNWYLKSKFGLYITLSYEGETGACGCFADGHMPSDINEIADNFDVVAFADMAQAIGVEYVNFTLYHAHVFTLCPNKTLEKYLPGHSARRDVIGELLDELHRRGIRLQLYIHATVGDTMTEYERERTHWYDSEGGYKKWNDFVCEFFAEICDRYGERMDSYYIDMIFDQPYLDMVDKARVREVIKSRCPNAVLTGNGEANETVDYSSREDCSIVIPDVNARRVFPMQTVILLGTAWWSTAPASHAPVNNYDASHLYKTLVLTAGANFAGGGMAVGCGPYCDRGFEPGVYETMLELGQMVAPVAESIKGTLASTSYITPSGARIPELTGGVAATRSQDDKFEYLHVLTPPEGDTLRLPLPTDRKIFSEAVDLRTGAKLEVTQDEAGVAIVNHAPWHELDTVIKLTVAGRREARSFEEYEIEKSQMSVTASDCVPGHGPELTIDGDKDSYWLTEAANMHWLDIDLGSERVIKEIVMLPRQDGEGREQLVTHINAYAVWAGAEKNAMRPVASGEWKRSMREKRAAFEPVRARYVRLSTGPDWLLDMNRSVVSAAEVRLIGLR